MKILYLHGFCAKLNGRKASCLRSHFGEGAVIEPEDPGLPYCKATATPALQTLGHLFKHKPRKALGLFGPNRIAQLTELSFDLANFFPRSVEMAQEIYNRTRPDIIVGSSLGGGVAMAMETGQSPLVLVGPVWNRRIKTAISSNNLPAAGKIKRAALSLATAALRGTVSQFAGFVVPSTIKPQTIILHSAYDEVFGLTHSQKLIKANPIASESPHRAAMNRVIDSLKDEGFANQESDGRLIIIGKDHHTNEPDPNDRRNKDPHPHHAMVAAVRLLAKEFGAA